jgi:hypothetical protein
MIELAYRFESTWKAEEYTCVRLYLSLLYLMHALSTIPCMLLDSSDCPSAVITEGCMMNVALEPVTPYVYRKVNTYTYNIVATGSPYLLQYQVHLFVSTTQHYLHRS